MGLHDGVSTLTALWFSLCASQWLSDSVGGCRSESLNEHLDCAQSRRQRPVRHRPADHADSAHNEEAENEARVRFCENNKLTFGVTGMCAGLDTALTAWC